MKPYIDTLAALVPAEALALYAGIVVPNVTNTISAGGKEATVISDPGLMGWSCAGLLILSAALYVIGRIKKNAKLTGWDLLKFMIPPAAFTSWMLVQNPSVWDIWWHGSSTAERVVIAAFAAVVLGILASALGYQVDQAPGPPAVDNVSPANGTAAGGGSVTVTGSGFTDATVVKFGTAQAHDLTVSSDTELTVTSPPANAGETVHVTVATAKGISATSESDRFTYS